MLNLDLERDYLKESVFLQADQEQEYLKLKQEINEEEHRLPAKITVINLKPKAYESKSNTLALRGTDKEELFS